MTEDKVLWPYYCRQCQKEYKTKKGALDHIAKTGRYSPKDGITYLHFVEGITEPMQ